MLAETRSLATYICRMKQERRANDTLSPEEWESLAKRLVKAELAHAGVTYKVLAHRLEALGVQANETAIANRLSRGQFTFIFFLQCMRALGKTEVSLKD